jgi:hypothetical protein
MGEVAEKRVYLKRVRAFMANSRLRLQRAGPIGDADIELGDLTILARPQATGKSIFLPS